MSTLIDIDGSQGEGGGQVLRTALALSAITGRPLRVKNIRAGRDKPGLMRQHLASANAITAITGGAIEGADVGSACILFTPGPIRAGEHHLAVGTAGSTMLVLQTILPALMLAEGPSTIIIEGGTHATAAPITDFIASAFLPLLARIGPCVDLHVARRGFYPAGGGKVRAQITPARELRALELHERGPTARIQAFAVVSRIVVEVARRELATIGSRLTVTPGEVHVIGDRDSPGPGNAVWVVLQSQHATEVFSAIGERQRSSEAVAGSVVEAVRAYLTLDAPVGPHLADQLLLPLALARAGGFTTGPLSLHTRTNMMVIESILDVRFIVREVDAGRVRITVET